MNNDEAKLAFGMCGKNMTFSIGNSEAGQRFTLDYEPDEQIEIDFMADMLTKAIDRLKAFNPKRARKVGGSYQASGTVVSTFQTLAGETRHVFEFDEPKGMLHIFSPAQIEFDKEGE